MVGGSRERGDMIVYPSFMLHRRTAITRGTRLAILVGAYGPAFR
jgi:predicted 2-oxoglutarate/Fe(II)-dependent dioxygenase YbiX